MDRRSFLTAMAMATASTTIGFTSNTLAAGASPDDVGPGCEGAVLALKGWINALAKKDFGFLEQHLASDFVFTTTPLKTPNGTVVAEQIGKEGFIAQDRHIHSSDIHFLGLTARRLGDLVITVVFAQINEEFRGNLGPQMPSAAEMNAFAKGKKLGYASGWREIDGRWQCTSHHVLGEIHHA
jgi:hypothetical protein